MNTKGRWLVVQIDSPDINTIQNNKQILITADRSSPHQWMPKTAEEAIIVSGDPPESNPE